MRSAFAALPFEAAMPDRVPMAVHGLDQWVDPAGIRAELVASISSRWEHVRIDTLEHATRVDSAEYFVETYDMMRKWMLQSYWSEESRQAATKLGEAGLDKIMIQHLRETYWKRLGYQVEVNLGYLFQTRLLTLRGFTFQFWPSEGPCLSDAYEIAFAHSLLSINWI